VGFDLQMAHQLNRQNPALELALLLAHDHTLRPSHGERHACLHRSRSTSARRCRIGNDFTGCNAGALTKQHRSIHQEGTTNPNYGSSSLDPFKTATFYLASGSLRFRRMTRTHESLPERLCATTLVALLLRRSCRRQRTGCALHTPAPGTRSIAPRRAAILPDKVFYRGQSATVQGRNSGGIRVADGKLVLFAIVDTSGYSSSVQETYQAYLITEVKLHIGDQTLAPGAYGFGFVANDKMVVMDLGANELARVATLKDPAMARPTPLQVLADAAANHYRLYLGRSYVVVSPEAK
jgi:hypothetical protein